MKDRPWPSSSSARIAETASGEASLQSSEAATAANSLTETCGATPPSARPSAGTVNPAAAPGNFQLARALDDIMDIPEFKPKDWRDIEGMGWLVLVDCDRPRDASGLAGPVKVGGKVYECIAVERTLNRRPTIHAGETIGLLLRAAR